MPDNSNFANSLVYMDPQAVLEFIKTRGEKAARSPIILQNELRPIDLFCYLGARFGPPNGIQTILRSDDSDNLIHWDWMLKSGNSVVIIMGLNFRTEVRFLGEEWNDLSDSSLVEQLRSDFANYGSKMSEVRKRLEHWTEFVNPYRRIRVALDSLIKELEDLMLDERRVSLEKLWVSENMNEVQEAWNVAAQAYSKGLGLCFGIRSMLPVMAEAYVNMLLFILMKSEIAADERLKASIPKQQIDLRIRGLRLYCEGFTEAPDYSNEICAKYHSLVNERNDLLHGNVAVDKLKFGEVFFYGKMPIFKEYKTMWERSFGVIARAVGLHQVHEDIKTVENMLTYLLSCLEPDIRKNIDFMLSRYELGLNDQTGRLGVLFPSWLVDIRMATGNNSEA